MTQTKTNEKSFSFFLSFYLSSSSFTLLLFCLFLFFFFRKSKKKNQINDFKNYNKSTGMLYELIACTANKLDGREEFQKSQSPKKKKLMK